MTSEAAIAATVRDEMECSFSTKIFSTVDRRSKKPSTSPQQMTTVVQGQVRRLSLPSPDTPLREGGMWGRFDVLFTPAFWRGQAWQHQLAGRYRENRLGRTLREEVAACLLGGFGMPAALGLAAYGRLRERDLLKPGTGEQVLREALLEPLLVDGQVRRYRFPAQRSRHLAGALTMLEAFAPPAADRLLRDALTILPGVGLKTASWIVRNHRASDNVAIIDIHILRAGRLAGIFSTCLDPAQDYFELERRFLAFADDLGVPASLLDALIWDYMRQMPGEIVRFTLDADNGDAARTKPPGSRQPLQ
jgi:thermostable 8-oxoguanine DNA glycosylase